MVVERLNRTRGGGLPVRLGAAVALVLVLVLTALLAGACATAQPEEPTPTPEAPRVQNCLVDGRSLRFEAEVRARIRQRLGDASTSVPFRLDPGAANVRRSSGHLYHYEAEYRLTGRGGQIDMFATGTIDARTCSASLSSLTP